MKSKTRTHQVAVAAYIFRENKLLLIKRRHPPFTLVPPGGRLQKDEDPLNGVHREVAEETGLTVEIVGIAGTWFGKITASHEPLLCINFLARYISGSINLSDEHCEYLWVNRRDIESGIVKTIDEHGNGYQAHSLLDAWNKFTCLCP